MRTPPTNPLPHANAVDPSSAAAHVPYCSLHSEDFRRLINCKNREEPGWEPCGPKTRLTGCSRWASNKTVHVWTVEQITSSGEGASTTRKFELSMKCTAVGDDGRCRIHVRSWKGRGERGLRQFRFCQVQGKWITPGGIACTPPHTSAGSAASADPTGGSAVGRGDAEEQHPPLGSPGGSTDDFAKEQPGRKRKVMSKAALAQVRVKQAVELPCRNPCISIGTDIKTSSFIPSSLTPHYSLLTPHSLPPHSSLLTPHSSLLTSHSSLLPPHSSLLTPHLVQVSMAQPAEPSRGDRVQAKGGGQGDQGDRPQKAWGEGEASSTGAMP